MTYIDHVIRDTYVEIRSELSDIGKLLYLLIIKIIFSFFFHLKKVMKYLQWVKIQMEI
jgi:hypothetical protein